MYMSTRRTCWCISPANAPVLLVVEEELGPGFGQQKHYHEVQKPLFSGAVFVCQFGENVCVLNGIWLSRCHSLSCIGRSPTHHVSDMLTVMKDVGQLWW